MEYLNISHSLSISPHGGSVPRVSIPRDSKQKLEAARPASSPPYFTGQSSYRTRPDLKRLKTRNRIFIGYLENTINPHSFNKMSY